MAPDLTAYRLRQARRGSLALALALREWQSVGDDFDTGWRRIGPRLTLLVASAQLGAARDALGFVADSVDVDPVATIKPAALAGLASDGRNLESLLYGAVVHARAARVDSLPERLQAGAHYLGRAVPTQVSDAGRDATRLAVVARPRVDMVRIASVPCCQRCAVLAGQTYRYSQGFKRHPRCDCSMVPETVAAPNAPGRDIGPEDVRDLTQKQREAIAAGHDMTKVINDYSRNGKWHLPPTRVERLTANTKSREEAVSALTRAGLLAA